MEIEILRKHGFSLRRIAAEVGCAVNTVRSHLATDILPTYERQKKRPSKISVYADYLRERQAAAHPNWIPATVLYREIVERGYAGGMSQLRAFLRGIRPALPADPVVRFETEPGEQMQVDWVEFRKGSDPLYAFCATLGYSRASHVEFVSDMKVGTLIECHQKAFVALGGVPKRLLFDNMKTVVLEMAERRGQRASSRHHGKQASGSVARRAAPPASVTTAVARRHRGGPAVAAVIARRAAGAYGGGERPDRLADAEAASAGSL